MPALESTTKTTDWRLLGQRVSHNVVIAAQQMITSALIVRPMNPSGPNGVHMISAGTAPSETTTAAIMYRVNT
jgi:hypothetical protein